MTEVFRWWLFSATRDLQQRLLASGFSCRFSAGSSPIRTTRALSLLLPPPPPPPLLSPFRCLSRLRRAIIRPLSYSSTRMASRVLLNVHRRARGAPSALGALALTRGGLRCTRAPCRTYTTLRADPAQPFLGIASNASNSFRSHTLPRYGVAMAARRLCSSSDLAVKPAAPLSRHREFSPASSLSCGDI